MKNHKKRRTLQKKENKLVHPGPSVSEPKRFSHDLMMNFPQKTRRPTQLELLACRGTPSHPSSRPRTEAGTSMSASLRALPSHDTRGGQILSHPHGRKADSVVLQACGWGTLWLPIEKIPKVLVPDVEKHPAACKHPASLWNSEHNIPQLLGEDPEHRPGKHQLLRAHPDMRDSHHPSTRLRTSAQIGK